MGHRVVPESERLECVLRDESAVLADDHHGGDRRALAAVALGCGLDFDPRELADDPFAVVAARAAAGASFLKRREDAVLVVGGDSFVAHGMPA